MPHAHKDWLADEKERLVNEKGCHVCGKGRGISSFEHYWDNAEPYKPRSYVLTYTDPELGDLSIGILATKRGITREELEAALATCVITCRKCFDPRRR